MKYKVRRGRDEGNIFERELLCDYAMIASLLDKYFRLFIWQK